MDRKYMRCVLWLHIVYDNQEIAQGLKTLNQTVEIQSEQRCYVRVRRQLSPVFKVKKVLHEPPVDHGDKEIEGKTECVAASTGGALDFWLTDPVQDIVNLIYRMVAMSNYGFQHKILFSTSSVLPPGGHIVIIISPSTPLH